MVSPILTLPLLDCGEISNTISPAISPAPPREADESASFASQLNHRLTQRSQSGRRKDDTSDARAQAAPLRDSDAPDAADTADTRSEQASADTQQDSDQKTDAAKSKTDGKDKPDTDGQPTASAASNPIMAVLTVPIDPAVSLALSGTSKAIAAAPSTPQGFAAPQAVPVLTPGSAKAVEVPVLQSLGLPQASGANVAPASASAAVQAIPAASVVTSNVTTAAPNLAVASSASVNPDTANSAATVAAPSSPLISSGVSTDSRAALPNAAPRVATATASIITPTPPAAASTLAAQASAIASPAVTNPTQANPFAQVKGATVPDNTIVVHPAAPGTDAAPADLVEQSTLPAVPGSSIPFAGSISANPTPANTPAGPASALPQAIVSQTPGPITQGVEEVAANADADAGVSGTATASVAPGSQNLEGIERLLTLGRTDRTAAPTEAPAVPATLQTAAQLPAEPAAPSGAAALPATHARASAHMPAFSSGPGTGVPAPNVLANATQSGAATPLALSGSNGMGAADGALSAPARLPIPLQQAAPGANAQVPAGEAASNPGSFTSTAARESGSANAGNGGQNQPGSQEPGRQADAAPVSAAAKTATDSAFPSVASALPVTSGSSETAAAAKTATASLSEPQDRAPVVEQVTRHLESMRLTSNSGEIRLRLTPHNLGSVHVTVSSHQDGVIARIAVESAQVQQVMEVAKEHLRASLEARGLHVHSVEVAVTSNLAGDGGAAFTGRGDGQSAPAPERAEWLSAPTGRAASRGRSSEAASPILAAAPAKILSDSRLDYRA